MVPDPLAAGAHCGRNSRLKVHAALHKGGLWLRLRLGHHSRSLLRGAWLNAQQLLPLLLLLPKLWGGGEVHHPSFGRVPAQPDLVPGHWWRLPVPLVFLTQPLTPVGFLSGLSAGVPPIRDPVLALALNARRRAVQTCAIVLKFASIVKINTVVDG